MTEFEEIELVLSQLLAAVGPSLTADQISVAREFVEAGEYHLALETIASMFAPVNRGDTTHRESEALIGRAAQLMDVDPVATWNSWLAASDEQHIIGPLSGKNRILATAGVGSRHERRHRRA